MQTSYTTSQPGEGTRASLARWVETGLFENASEPKLSDVVGSTNGSLKEQGFVPFQRKVTLMRLQQELSEGEQLAPSPSLNSTESQTSPSETNPAGLESTPAKAGRDDYEVPPKELGMDVVLDSALNLREAPWKTQCSDFGEDPRSQDDRHSAPEQLPTFSRPIGPRTYDGKFFSSSLNNPNNHLTLAQIHAKLAKVLKEGDVIAAHDSFRALQGVGVEMDVVAYNMILAGFMKKQMFVSAEALLHEMNQRRVKPDATTFNTLMSGFGKAEMWNATEGVFEEMIAAGIDPNAATFATLAAGYLRQGDGARAFKVLQAMQESGVSGSVYTMNVVLSAYTRLLDMEGAVRVFNDMVACGIMPSNATYNCLISGFLKVGSTEAALYLFSHLYRNWLDLRYHGSLRPDKFKVEDLDPAMRVKYQRELHALDELQLQRNLKDIPILRGIEYFPTVADLSDPKFAFSGITPIKAIQKLSSVPASFNEEANREGSPSATPTSSTDEHFAILLQHEGQTRPGQTVLAVPDVCTFNTLLHGLTNESSRTHLVAPLVKIMNIMEARPNVTTYNMLLRHAFANQKNVKSEQILTLLHDMANDGLKPDRFTFNIIIHGLACRQELDRIWDIFEKMELAGVQPDIITLNSVLTAISKSIAASMFPKQYAGSGSTTSEGTEESESENAHMPIARRISYWNAHIDRVLEALQKYELTPDIVTFTTLIGAYLNLGDVTRVEQTRQAMRAVNMLPNDITIVTLIAGYSRLVRFDMVLSMIPEIKQLNMIRNPFVARALLQSFAKLSQNPMNAIVRDPQRSPEGNNGSGVHPAPAERLQVDLTLLNQTFVTLCVEMYVREGVGADLGACNAYLTVLAHAGHADLALELVRHMERTGEEYLRLDESLDISRRYAGGSLSRYAGASGMSLSAKHSSKLAKLLQFDTANESIQDSTDLSTSRSRLTFVQLLEQHGGVRGLTAGSGAQAAEKSPETPRNGENDTKPRSWRRSYENAKMENICLPPPSLASYTSVVMALVRADRVEEAFKYTKYMSSKEVPLIPSAYLPFFRHFLFKDINLARIEELIALMIQRKTLPTPAIVGTIISSKGFAPLDPKTAYLAMQSDDKLSIFKQADETTHTLLRILRNLQSSGFRMSSQLISSLLDRTVFRSAWITPQIAQGVYEVMDHEARLNMQTAAQTQTQDLPSDDNLIYAPQSGLSQVTDHPKTGELVRIVNHLRKLAPQPNEPRCP